MESMHEFGWHKLTSHTDVIHWSKHGLLPPSHWPVAEASTVIAMIPKSSQISEVKSSPQSAVISLMCSCIPLLDRHTVRVGQLFYKRYGRLIPWGAEPFRWSLGDDESSE